MQNKHPIYYYLAQADIQIGVQSTTIFEGLAYELKTFILNTEGADITMGDIYEKKHARLFHSAQELFDIINDEEWFNPIAQNEFFIPNSKENMINEINKYLA